MPGLKSSLGAEYPNPSLDLQEQRVQIFYDQHKWKEARAEWEKLAATLRDPQNPHRQHALLRAAQARFQLKAAPTVIQAVATSNPDVDAERMFAFAQAERTAKKETEMLSASEQLIEKYPSSKWSEEALMMVGNYYWVELDRPKAIGYYQRVIDNFPAGKYAFFCEWRTAWIAYLDRQPYADDKLTVFLRKYPVSANASDTPAHISALLPTASRRHTSATPPLCGWTNSAPVTKTLPTFSRRFLRLLRCAHSMSRFPIPPKTAGCARKPFA